MAKPAWMDAPEAPTVTSAAQDPPSWASAPPVNITPSADRPEAVDRFVSNFASAVNPVPGIRAIATDPQGVRHGIEQNVFQPQMEQFSKANDAARGRGEFAGMTPLERASSAVGHGAAGALPLVGPAAANAGDQIGNGDVAGGLGSGAGLLSTIAVPDLMRGTGAGMSHAAEPIAETALGIRNVDRKFGRNPGRAALNETTGVRPESVTRQAGDRLADLTRQRDAALTASPNQVSLKPARTAVEDAITRASAGNSDTSHLIPIREQLNDPRAGFAGATQPTPAGPLTISELQDPMNALAIRQRLGNDFTKFDMARPVSRESQTVGNKAYGALTNEIHNAVPESAPLDARISNLIPVKQSADVRALAPDTIGRIAHRFIPHTGALIGAAEGARLGGIPGAIAGLTIPELMADPTAQMIAARGLDTAGRVTRHPITGQIIRGAQNIRPNGQPQ